MALVLSGGLVASPFLLPGTGSAAHGTPTRPQSRGAALPLLATEQAGYDSPLSSPAKVAAAAALTTPTPATTTTTPATTTAPAATTATTTATTTAQATASPAPVATPAPSAAPTASNSVTGEATWYAAAAAGGCASPSLPMGTEVQVVDETTGATTDCVVDDREPTSPGRVVDLSYGGFAALASPTQGVVTVTLSW